MEILKSKFSKKENCIHTRNITVFYDLAPTDDQYKIYSKHLNECSACKKAYNHFAEEMKAIQVFIPKTTMDGDFKQSLDREIHELLVSLNLDVPTKKRNIFWGKVNYLGEELIKSVSSKTMAWGLVAAVISYILLKFN
jgi:hypothetical protein